MSEPNPIGRRILWLSSLRTLALRMSVHWGKAIAPDILHVQLIWSARAASHPTNIAIGEPTLQGILVDPVAMVLQFSHALERLASPHRCASRSPAHL